MAKDELYEEGSQVVWKVFSVTMVSSVLFIAGGMFIVFST